MDCPLDVFLGLLPEVLKGKQNDSREGFLKAAFIGWQVQETVKGVVGGNLKPQRFFDYAKSLGLWNDNEGTQTNVTQQKKLSAEEAFAIADKIRAADMKTQKGLKK